MPFRLPWLLLPLLFLPLLVPGAAQAQDCPRPLVVAMSSMNPRPGMAPSALERMAEDLMAELANRSGLRIERREMPRIRAFNEFKTGTVDLVPVATRTDEREGWGRLLPMGRAKAMLLVRKDRAGALHKPEDLLYQALTVSLVRGQAFGLRFDSFVEKLERAGRLSVVSDQLAIVRMIKAGRSDAALGLPAVFEPALQAEGWADEIRILDLDLADAVDEGTYVSRLTPAGCVERLEKASEQLRESGWYRGLQVRHLSPAMRQGLLP
ncbi:transporter substrate-binding domain-containing protein [Pelomonas sp. SE-A7]|uniref:substrate-binding periplasmic protein n=1 Tax=Pelomonas sp. SE-A7 TaxID=3054953 RepID=UPI00259C6EDA|nr:transporter substrate-binding domain-containing protein [Pelomonas sp. SE-A7]MDM4765838.1 transporter substrate-binding domain-containing protein [Pelomonas sp. SE-A7]